MLGQRGAGKILADNLGACLRRRPTDASEGGRRIWSPRWLLNVLLAAHEAEMCEASLDKKIN